MSAREIAEFTDAEKRAVEAAVRERYRGSVAVDRVEAELRLGPASPVLISCPAIYWSARGAQFVVVKLPRERYRAQFFYSDNQHYGTGRTDYQSLVESTLDILRAQADHELERQGIDAGTTGGRFCRGGRMTLERRAAAADAVLRESTCSASSKAPGTRFATRWTTS